MISKWAQEIELNRDEVVDKDRANIKAFKKNLSSLMYLWSVDWLIFFRNWFEKLGNMKKDEKVVKRRR